MTDEGYVTTLVCLVTQTERQADVVKNNIRMPALVRLVNIIYTAFWDNSSARLTLMQTITDSNFSCLFRHTVEYVKLCCGKCRIISRIIVHANDALE